MSQLAPKIEQPTTSLKLPEFIELFSKPEGAVAFAEDWYAYNTTSHFWFDWRFRAVKKLLAAAHLPLDKNLAVLDIGCGTGIVREQLEGVTVWTIDGTDLNLGALALIKPGRGRTFYYDILTQQPEFKERYDVVILFDVIEHLETTREFLQAVAFHLKPGGALLINVPALESMRSIYDTVVGHFRRYDTTMMRAEIEAAGLTVRDMRYWGFSMLPLLKLRQFNMRRKKSHDAAAIVKSGIQPPGAVSHAVLRLIMRVESAIFSRPPSGTSLLCWVERR